MIITCPDCATRYDIDDERFSPNGRSVRCSSCGESWFVPAPELLDVEPLDKKPPKRPAEEKDDSGEDSGPGARPRMKVGVPDDEEDERDAPKEAKRSRREWREDDERENERAGKRDRNDGRPGYRDDDEDDDDSLFETPSSRKPRNEDDEDESLGKGWRKGRQFIVEDDEEEDARPFFPRKRKAKAEERESLRFADESGEGEEAGDDGGFDEAYVVDADWEAVEDADAERSRGFGRKIRAERRRATALARMEDVRPLDPEDLDEEFFTALKVTPRELERAIRKARRRAEAREKNRLTPLRVVGWAAWLAVVAGAVYGVVVYRDEIVKVAPKAADAYAVIGIEASPYGLAIENVRHRLAMSTGGPTIEITGNLRNETDATVAAPLLQAEALGGNGELLARWTFSANRLDVQQGETVEFITRAPAPDGVAEVALSFAPEKSVLESLTPGKGE